MPITRCNEIGEGRTASDDIEGPADAVRRWRVETDDPDIDAVQILDTAHTSSPDPIAVKGELHPSSSQIFCKTRECSQEGGDDEGNRSFIVTCNYSNQFSQDPADYQANPLDRNVLYTLEWGQYTKIVTKDADNVAILNTVHDRFDEPLEDDDARPIMVAIRNEDAASFASIVALALDYKDAVNSDSFYGASPGFVKMGPILTGPLQYENGVSFFSVRYEFHFHEEPAPGIEGWARQILNRGNRAYATADDPFSLYTIKNGPKNILEDGRVQGPSDDPYYITVLTKRRRPFGALNL